MSDDEILILLLSLGLTAWLGVLWYLRLMPVGLAKYPGPWRRWLGVAPIGALLGVFVVLRTMASFDVREAAGYLFFYTMHGAAWIFSTVGLMLLFGVSLRDDAAERRNPAAAIILIAAMVAQATIYAGGNIGDGPGWWVVLTAALIGGGAWYALWWGVETATGASEEITVGRDVPMAVRLGGYMVASGIICGRGVAGDWVSLANTVAEFGDAWPVLVLAALAIGVERLIRGGAMRKSTGIAVGLAAAYLAFAVLALMTSPPLADNPAYPQTVPAGP